MSKWTELAKLLPKAINNIDKVAEGYINDIKLRNNTLPQDQVEEIAKRRIICSTCPFMSKNAAEAQIYTTEIKIPHCMHCGCSIKKKTASLSSNCGIEDYNEKNPQDPMPLKWTAYTTE